MGRANHLESQGSLRVLGHVVRIHVVKRGLVKVALGLLLAGLVACGDASPEPRIDVESGEANASEVPLPVLTRSPAPEWRVPEGTSEPRYCRVVFGTTGSNGRWLIDSGDAIHVDRDGDGAIADEAPANGIKGDRRTTFDVGPLQVGGEVYTMSVVRWDAGTYYVLVVDPERRRWRAWGDHRGLLVFGASSTTAPVVHFDGPLSMGIETQVSVRSMGPGTYRIAAGVGCRGLGAGSFACLECDQIPPSATPIARVVVPPEDTRLGPIEVTAPLTGRC